MLAKELAVLQAEKNLIREMLPASTTKHTAGLSVSGELLETTLMAYEGLNDAAAEVAEQLKEDRGATTYVIWTVDLNSKLLAYKAFQRQLEQLEAEYKLILEPKATKESFAAVAPLLPGAITSTLGGIGDILTFFRTDVKIESKAVTIPDDALAAALAKALGRKPVYHPALYTPHVLSLGGSNLFNKLDDVRKLVSQAERLVGEYEAQKDEDKQKNEWKNRIAQLKAANTAARALFTRLNAAENGTTPLMELLRADGLVRVVDDDGARILQAKVLQSGGANKMTNSFWRGHSLSHSGGSLVGYFAFDKEGQVRCSGTAGVLTAFRKLPTNDTGTRLTTGFDNKRTKAAPGAKTGGATSSSNGGK